MDVITGDAWIGLEWLLMGVSLGELIVGINLIIFASTTVCCSKKSANTVIRSHNHSALN